jgi:ATP-dependent RNA helicase DDX60
MHYEGLSTKYRQVVEVLFRKGFLKVVFATGTLALGINMPCRSVIFTGNEIELNGLMYRQMAGRAGRRGFDLLGNVIFMGVPFQKISRLVSSDMPSLSGEMNLSATTLLRVLIKHRELTLMKHENSNLKLEDYITDQCLKPIFSTPFYEAKNPEERQNLACQLLLHAKFSLEFLYQEGEGN